MQHRCQLAWSSDLANYDVNHDGVVDAAEWSPDPRVRDVNGNGYLDPEDLIAAFSCRDRFNETLGVASWPGGVLHGTNGAAGVSNTGGAYPHDISGWNFYRNSSDPATADAAYTHADDQMTAILSTCPKCMTLPVKAGAEALDFTDTLARAWLFAGPEGAAVITSVTADLGYSTFMHSVIAYLHSRGVVMVEASNDFDSTDHQGGMFWPHVIPGNGVVPTANGTGWVSSNFTSWGTHNMFSVAGAATTSQSTAELGGLFGLLLSWSMNSPSAGDLLSTGGTDLVPVTREGYVFAWRTAGGAAQNNQWWRTDRDEDNSDRYATHTRPPGVARDIHWRRGDGILTFTAPGDVWYSGTVRRYRVSFTTAAGITTVSLPPGGAAGTVMQVSVPEGTRAVTIQAIGTTGLLGLPVRAPRSIPADPR